MNKKQFYETVQKAELFLTNYKEKNKPLATWECPCCKSTQETPRPTRATLAPNRKFWSSAKMCMNCGAASFVNVPTRGQCEVTGQLTKRIV